ncbi:MAG: hypothetical protein JO033_25960 [Acidobacteriaceae bacterium]|nr:hypothetical protein [Acidobacteriaceae bacterium]MBV9499672.1 hypothetical protein [Acidobacteriaceae bacterium]
MSEAEPTASANARASAHIDTICDCIRSGLEAVSDAITPPESACRHFREARIEMLRGIRDIIDHRIEHLSRGKRTGTRVVVE